ncbi:MAG TPA: hypothetical protein PKI62_13955 [bacterium]|nr:hypothetical protein [bacterium]HPR89305.1 hypothetical protein [bacterium]
MSRFLTLTWILLKSSYTPLASGRFARGKSVALLVLVCVSLLPLIGGLAMLVGNLYTPLAAVGQQGIILAFGCALTGLLIFIFGIFYVINTYYFAQDVEFLLPLPLRPGQILGAKFTVTLFFEYLTQLLILAPLLVTYGIKSGAGLSWYLIAAAVFLSLPVIPLVLASLLAMVLMSYSSVARHKDRFRIWAGGFGLAAALGLQYLMQKVMVNKKPEEIVRMLQEGKNSLADLGMRLFPGVKFAVYGLLQSGPAAGGLYLLIFLLLSALAVLMMMAAGRALYFRGAIGGSEIFAPRRALTGAELAETGRSNRPLRALMLKEIRLLVRTPAFFMNCVLINFIWPVMLLFMGSSGDPKEIEGLRTLLSGGLPANTLLLIMLGASFFISGTSGASASGISREGSQFFVSKYLPVPATVLIQAKLAVAWLLSCTGLLLLLATVGIAFHMPAAILGAGMLLALPAMLLPVLAGLILDIHFPKLVWDNEYRAVKQNMNIMALMAISGLLGAGCIWLALKHGSLGWTLVAAVAGLTLLADGVLYALLQKKGTAWLAAIQA